MSELVRLFSLTISLLYGDRLFNLSLLEAVLLWMLSYLSP